MPSMKVLLTTFVIVLVSVAIINRVGALQKIVTPNGAA